MSQVSTTPVSSSHFQDIFRTAVESYRRQTRNDLIAHPLASQLQSCDSTTAILAILQDQVRVLDRARSGDERLTKWLSPTVNVLCAFSVIAGSVGFIFSPATVIFAGIGVFVQAANDVAANRDVLAELFERIRLFFTRLETYTEVAPTTAMTDVITQILVEVLKIFGIATKELRRRSAITFLRNLAGMANLEYALKNLDRLTQEEARMALAEVLRITQSVEDKVDGIKWNQLKQILQAWLSPADPSTNHNIARKAQHKGTSVWFFQGRIVMEWKSVGSLLWIHGKPGSGKSIICSSVVQDIMALCEAGSAIMAYFYFDFRDINKKSCHDLLLSLVFQLSTRSSPCCDILHHVYETHEDGTRQPSDDTLKECLKEMLRLLARGPTYIIMDALDECPDCPGIPSPRYEVLQIVEELVNLGLPHLHICVTSRPEVNIRVVVEPLAFRSVSLHDERGQKSDIAHYVRNVVDLSPSLAMSKWREDDRNLVIETLVERADGMFRWVFCQLDALQHCFPPNLRQFLNELPETLDETYERILKGINRAQKDSAHRLLQCLTVAARPLRVEELAELLAFDFQASLSGGIPTLKEDWRWADQEEAVLSTCSSLIAIVPNGHSRVVQFSHFSVKEYLTSLRLARSPDGDVSRFHIDLDSAHTIMAQACLATLLRLDEHAGYDDVKRLPLVEYAAQHWVGHAQFDKVSSRIQDGMDDLFDTSKPHFAAWLRVHNIDERWSFFGSRRGGIGSPLYYAALCGFYDLAERLIMKHPDQVNERGGLNISPLPAALYKGHLHVANLLYTHGAVVDVYSDKYTPLITISASGEVDIMRWLLDRGADANAQGWIGQTPLHHATLNRDLDAVQLLLEHDADINRQSDLGRTPLYDVLTYGGSVEPKGKVIDIVRRLLEHGASPNIPNFWRSTPLHRAASRGFLEVCRLLLSYGAKVNENDEKGRTPFQVAASKGHDEIAELLLEYGAVRY